LDPEEIDGKMGILEEIKGELLEFEILAES
jgi:hypothetical protein